MPASPQSILQLNTSISSSPVWITQLEGYESFSKLFNYRLQLASQRPITDAYKLVGTLISFSIVTSTSEESRDFNGLLINFTVTGENIEKSWYYYEIELSPWLWLLTQRSNCRIFPGQGQRKAINVKQVLEELFQDYSSFQVDLTGISNTAITHDFWLQYNETDFQFFSRLTETFGIFYYFVQSRDQHNLILSDQKQAYSSKIHNISSHHFSGHQQQRINSWKHVYRFVPKKWTLNSHNSEQPTTQLNADAESCVQHKRQGPAEHYQYHANYLQRDQGLTLAKSYIEAEEARNNIAEAESNIIALAVGEHVKLDKKSFPQENTDDFIITELSFSIKDASLPSSDHDSQPYQNYFQCIPATSTYHPQIITDQPHGNQLHEAIVTGADSEEIHTDDLHRLRVQFLWDRIGANDINSSCWIRCASHWEGLLRVGTPVLVGFLHNDLNQPIVLGPLYDIQQKPLFAEPTMSGFKRRHGTQGDDSYYNELRFNDKKDNAEIYLHACKDMHAAIDNDLTTIIKNNYSLTVEQARTTEIKESNDSLTIDKGNWTININQGKCEITVKGDITIKSSGNIIFEATQNLKLSAQQIDIEAKTTLSQKAAQASIEASTTLALKGATTSIDGSETIGIKGGMIQLN